VRKRELQIGTVLTLAGGYTSRCQRHDTLSTGKQEPSSEAISQVVARKQFGAKGDGDEIALTERREERLRLTETAWIRIKSAQHRGIRRVAFTRLPAVFGVFDPDRICTSQHGQTRT
jgi:hypothetical protein